MKNKTLFRVQFPSDQLTNEHEKQLVKISASVAKVFLPETPKITRRL